MASQCIAVEESLMHNVHGTPNSQDILEILGNIKMQNLYYWLLSL